MLKRFSCGLLLLLSAAAGRGDIAGAEALEGTPLDGDRQAFDDAVASAEAALRAGHLLRAESQMRVALREGFMARGRAAAAAGRPTDARRAFEAAARSTLEAARPYLALADVLLDLGDPRAALPILYDLLARQPGARRARALLAEALFADRRPRQAVAELEALVAGDPDDLEARFELARGFLRLGDADRAEALFDSLLEARPGPETRVLIGRTYRDFGRLEAARQQLEAALEGSSEVRRAHYYLGTVALLENGPAALDQAIAHFRAEHAQAPRDPATNRYLGMALVERRQHESALAALEIARERDPESAAILLYIGRAERGLGRLDRAAEALESALAAAEARFATSGQRDPAQLASIHYQLAVAWRNQGRIAESAPHFEVAKRLTEGIVKDARSDLARFLASDLPGARNPGPATGSKPPVLRRWLRPIDRPSSGRSIESAELARVYLNLGVLKTRAGRFADAAWLLEQAAELEAQLPELQYTLGVARFNAGHFQTATSALEAARPAGRNEPARRRMLALAQIETGDFRAAASLLADDPERSRDVSLQYAYALALVRSEQLETARPIFDALFAAHGDWPQLGVLVGEAHAQEGDYPAAIAALEETLKRQPDVAEAHATLGMLHLRRGDLEAAVEAFRAELALRPKAARVRFLLATALDLDRRPQDARVELETVLAVEPAHADARYLLGKILLAEGDSAAAIEQLETAAQLAPGEPSVRYQLGRAYRSLGRLDDAEHQFERFRQLKRAAREKGP